MSKDNRRTYADTRRRRSSSNTTRRRREGQSRERAGSRPNLSEREYQYLRRRKKRLIEKRKRAQRRRRRLFLLILVFVVFLTGRSFMSLMNREPKKEEVAITTVDSGNSVDNKETVSEENSGSPDKPVFGTYDRNNWIRNLNIAAKTNPNAKLIVDNINTLPAPLIKLSGNNFDAIDFVAKSIDPSVENKFRYSEDLNGSRFPYYIQWDDRWGYEKYAGGIIGHTGCAPTVMAMAISGVTGTKTTPTEMAEVAAENGHSNNSGTGWSYYPFMAEKYGLKLEELPKDDKQMKSHLEAGHPIIISVKPGQFTQVGHVMMLVGVDENGKYIMNDPNSLQNTQKHWDYSEIQGDLKKIWALYQ